MYVLVVLSYLSHTLCISLSSYQYCYSQQQILLFMFTLHVDPVLMLVLYTVALTVVVLVVQCSGVLLVCIVLLAYCTIGAYVQQCYSLYTSQYSSSITSHPLFQQLLCLVVLVSVLVLVSSSQCQQYCMLMQARGQKDTQCTVLDYACYAVLCCTTLSYALYYLLFMLSMYLTPSSHLCILLLVSASYCCCCQQYQLKHTRGQCYTQCGVLYCVCYALLSLLCIV